MLTCKKYGLILMQEERNRGTGTFSSHAFGSRIVSPVNSLKNQSEKKIGSERERKKEKNIT